MKTLTSPNGFTFIQYSKEDHFLALSTEEQNKFKTMFSEQFPTLDFNDWINSNARTFKDFIINYLDINKSKEGRKYWVEISKRKINLK